MSRVLVVGGGISGLTAALAIAEAAPGVVEVEVLEGDQRIGGKLRSTPFGGRPAVDEGADAFLRRVPHGLTLATRVGLADDLTSPTAATAAVWHERLHPIPEGLLLGVPADMIRLAGSGLLSWRGKARAALEPLLPRTDAHDSIGRLVRARFGDEVHDRLVDALVGSIYAADTDHFSLAMVPQLAALAGKGRSLLLSARAIRAAAPPAAGPVFAAPASGMGALADAVAAEAIRQGVTITRGATVARVERDGTRWRVDDRTADAVVLATPAAATAPLVTGVAPDLAAAMSAMHHAGVVIVTMTVDDWPERLRGRSGYLVPKPDQRTVTAVSFGSQKWAHWAGPGEVLRVSLGRDGNDVTGWTDDDLVSTSVDELNRHLDLDVAPNEVRITRWPAAFPQYRPGHERWLAAVDAATPTGLFVAGASYRGIGVPACIADAERAAGAAVSYVLSRPADRTV
ncbi:protoporphyrinogen oxidase [Desertimonas flava]|uniref:protoporphyrinogen oxidase n=1 Tax=Desertimonas flava TaxID=2064846 RepID=UPI000E3459A2|nr:protoporphyrinogen oxidase [Desertimonas flava]